MSVRSRRRPPHISPVLWEVIIPLVALALTLAWTRAGPGWVV